jgi:hypothetical protein
VLLLNESAAALAEIAEMACVDFVSSAVRLTLSISTTFWHTMLELSPVLLLANVEPSIGGGWLSRSALGCD